MPMCNSCNIGYLSKWRTEINKLNAEMSPNAWSFVSFIIPFIAAAAIGAAAPYAKKGAEIAVKKIEEYQKKKK